MAAGWRRPFQLRKRGDADQRHGHRKLHWRRRQGGGPESGSLGPGPGGFGGYGGGVWAEGAHSPDYLELAQVTIAGNAVGAAGPPGDDATFAGAPDNAARAPGSRSVRASPGSGAGVYNTLVANNGGPATPPTVCPPTRTASSTTRPIVRRSLRPAEQSQLPAQLLRRLRRQPAARLAPEQRRPDGDHAAGSRQRRDRLVPRPPARCMKTSGVHASRQRQLLRRRASRPPPRAESIRLRLCLRAAPQGLAQSWSTRHRLAAPSAAPSPSATAAARSQAAKPCRSVLAARRPAPSPSRCWPPHDQSELWRQQPLHGFELNPHSGLRTPTSIPRSPTIAPTSPAPPLQPITARAPQR